jgi:hypothetical protein
MIFAIGIGPPDTEDFECWQDLDTSESIKTFLLRRIANDPVSARVGAPEEDPPFPPECIPGYDGISAQPRGIYLTSPNAEDLTAMLRSVARSIKVMLIE